MSSIHEKRYIRGNMRAPYSEQLHLLAISVTLDSFCPASPDEGTQQFLFLA